MKLEVLISTMNQKEIKDDFCKSRNIYTDCVIVNQNKEKNKQEVINNKTIIHTTERGLSKSRNKAIEYSKADICLICDDDIKMNPDYERIILEAYNTHRDADAITFLYTHGGILYDRVKAKKTIKHNRFTLLRVASSQITFKRFSIIKNNINFDTRFGLGSKMYESGEENLFLMDMYKKGLKIYHVPLIISDHVPEVDSNSFFDENLIFAKAAFFRAYDKHFCLIYMIALFVLNKKIIDKNISLRKYINICFRGFKDYDNKLVNND